MDRPLQNKRCFKYWHFPCASKSSNINFSEQCLHIHSHKPRINLMKGFNRMKHVNLKQIMIRVITMLK